LPHGNEEEAQASPAAAATAAEIVEELVRETIQVIETSARLVQNVS
jgi:hypothetical protein